MRALLTTALAVTLALAVAPADAAFVVEIDTDGLDDGVLTFPPSFSFGGDTTTASQSSPSTAVGLTGGDSIFGGDGVNSPDTYVYTYTPGSDGDNLQLPAGTLLNANGDTASGQIVGAAGLYNVYAAWPYTENVSGGETTFELSDSNGVLFSTPIDQNFQGNEWVLVGSANLDPNETYTLAQMAGSNTFVSMRASAVMFDFPGAVIPEPTTISLVGIAALGLFFLRRRSN